MPTQLQQRPAETHPVIAGAFSDPTVCRVGDDYYIAHSSFEYFPGAPIHTSPDMVSWTHVANILSRREQFERGDGAASGGIFGSTLRHHGGVFWFVTTNVSGPDLHQTIVSAQTAHGPWSDPVVVKEARGIDPDLAWDEDGACYLTWCHLDLKDGVSTIRQAPVDLDTGELLETAYDIWSGTGLAFPEGPHLYSHDGTWYLVIAEGGTERGHCVSVARGPSPRGPFESHPANPIFSRRSTSHSVQNTGHADLVELADGSWAAVYLGVRARGTAPGFYTVGRETFLSDVTWEDGWPVFTPATRCVAPACADVVDEFVDEKLDVAWVVPGGEPDSIASIDPVGGLRLVRDDRGDAASLLCRRVRHLAWSATVDVDIADGGARFVVRIDHRHWYGVEAKDGSAIAVARVGDLEQRFDAVPVATSVQLRLRAVAPDRAGQIGANTGPDEIVLEVADGEGKVTELARLDGRYVSSEVAGGFTGRVLGIGAIGPSTRVVRMRYRADGA